MRGFLVLVAVAVVAACLASSAPAALRGRLCGQIQHGPKTAWALNVAGKTAHFSGNTWSVFALPAVPCATPMTAARGLLAQWSKAKVGATLPLQGWLCTKDRTVASARASGDVSCVDYGGNASKYFIVVMIAPYSPAAFEKAFGR